MHQNPRVCCSTAAAEVTGELADEARSRGEHLQGQIDGGDGARDVASDQPGQELRDPLLGNNTRTENNSDLAATVENLKARLTEQEAQFEALSKRLGMTRACLPALYVVLLLVRARSLSLSFHLFSLARF